MKGEQKMNVLKMLNRPDLIRSVLSILVITFLVAIAIGLVTGWVWMAGVVAVVTCSYVVCCTSLSGRFFVAPKTINDAIVIERRLAKHEDIPAKTDDKALTELQPTTNLRVIFGPGVSGISLLEKITHVISCARSKKLGKDWINIQTSDGVNGRVKIKAFATPIRHPEAIMNLARQTEEYAVEFLEAQFVAFIRSEIKKITYDQLMSASFDDPDDATKKVSGMDLVKKRFNKLFGGPGTISATEWQLGLYTGDPIITEVDMDQDAKDAQQMKWRATQQTSAIKTIVDETGVNPNVAANMVSKEHPATVVVTAISGDPGKGPIGPGGNSGAPSGAPAQAPIIILQVPTQQTNNRKEK